MFYQQALLQRACPTAKLVPDHWGSEAFAITTYPSNLGTFLIGLWQQKQMTKLLNSWDSRLSVCLRLFLISCLLHCPAPISWVSR